MSEERKVFCTACGAENNGNFKFCSSCGAKLEQSVPAEETPMVETPVMDALAADAAAETVYSGETTPYSSDVSYGNTTYATEAPATEEIQINYSQDNGSFSGNTYEAQPQYYTAEPMPQKNGNKGFAIASLVCGILAVICCCFSCVSLVLAIAAVALGIVTLACKYDGKGMAIAGIVMGGLGILMFVGIIIIGASDGYNSQMLDEIMNEFELY